MASYPQKVGRQLVGIAKLQYDSLRHTLFQQENKRYILKYIKKTGGLIFFLMTNFFFFNLIAMNYD